MRTLPSTSRRSRALAVLAGTALASLVAGCQGGLASTGTDINTAQAMLDLGESMTSLREENAAMQAQIDSLRSVLAYQDTVLRQLAAAGGISMRAQSMIPPL